MENLEHIKSPEIKIDELLTLISAIKWEDGFEFSYNGINFLLFLVTPEEHDHNESKEEAEYFQSTATDGWDIYILETISGEKREQMLFHEIVECSLRDQGFSNSKAHQLTLKEEQKNFKSREK